jgi:sec-independent protein translocase protein TatA
MGGFSIWHVLIVAIILLLVFGGNRFSSMMGDVAKGLKSFKQGMADEDEEKQRRFEEQRRYEEQQRRSEPPRQLPREDAAYREPIDVTPRREEPVAPPPPPRDDEPR